MTKKKISIGTLGIGTLFLAAGLFMSTSGCKESGPKDTVIDTSKNIKIQEEGEKPVAEAVGFEE